MGLSNLLMLSNFYPRPPRGGRLQNVESTVECLTISIHALREEGDRTWFLPVSTPSVFLSTPSARRATDAPRPEQPCPSYFYPRPPRGGRPAHTSWQPPCGCISIHALREEGDLDQQQKRKSQSISIHALREEGDGQVDAVRHFLRGFLSTPSARRAT